MLYDYLGDCFSYIIHMHIKKCILESCYIDYAKAFDCVDHNKLWKILKEMGIPDHLNSLLRKLYVVRKQQLELDMEQRIGSK